MHQQQRNRRRRDALDARGQAQRFRPVLHQLLPHFARQAADVGVVEVIRQPGVFGRAQAIDLVLLAVDVALILGQDVELFDRSGMPACASRSCR